MYSIVRLRVSGRVSGLVAASIVATGIVLFNSPAFCQSRQPDRVSPPEFEWKQTAALEHEDRKNRFRRLASQGLLASPQFHEAIINRKYLSAFGIDLPVLRLVFSQQVFFDTDKSDLRADSLPILDVVARSLQRDVPDVAVFVAGHADARGSDDYNYKLSIARANVVARFLYSRGIGVARLWSVGFGKAVPVKPNTSPENMAENRRVEFLFAARPEAVAVWLSQQSRAVCLGATGDALLDCTQRIAAIPPIVATPVLGEQTTVPSLETKSPASVAADRPPVPIGSEVVKVPSDEGRTAINAGSNRQVVQIEKNSPIIIDLREQRVSVGAPIL
jgi:outer membrane protein OmpA-like peptidoglycan-associated protein